VKLHYRQFGEAHTGVPLLLLHGLLGSLVNWQRIARRLAENHRVIVPDLRNHGRSPHHPDVSYPAMTGDVLALLDDLGVDRAVPVGHSMGGKVAMWLALNHPDRVTRLVVADIAPVRYQGRLGMLLDALLALPLERIEKRAEADALLARRIPDAAVRAYLLQNLVRTDSGWRWRSNLQALRDGLDLISGFPEVPPVVRYEGPALFIRGDRSDYVKAEYLPVMERLFPDLELVTLEAGHWVYAEQPERFVSAVEAFLHR
jgi:pimeloyl-ACP methyl ester carboxylesterase